MMAAENMSQRLRGQRSFGGATPSSSFLSQPATLARLPKFSLRSRVVMSAANSVESVMEQ